jgi:hypothetical protein
MKNLKLPSTMSPNNSILLIIFIFIFIAIGMFYMIQKTTEKKNKEKEDKKNKIIEEKERIATTMNEKAPGHYKSTANGASSSNADTSDEYTTEYNTVSGTFDDEVGLFIKKDETRPEIYSHSPTYIPPFNNGAETRCVTRQINRPNETNVVQSCSSSNLVKIASNASY